MTDNEIIKALECCAQPVPICKECPCYDSDFPYPCADQLKWETLNLIDSQQAEIERLQKYNTEIAYKHYNYGIKEFAEMLKRKLQWDIGYDDKFIFENDIDSIVKEIVGDTE